MALSRVVRRRATFGALHRAARPCVAAGQLHTSASFPLAANVARQPARRSTAAASGRKGDLALSFGGSGLMLVYQAGVASAFHACPDFMARVVRVLGTSGGACVSLLLLASPQLIEAALEHYCAGALFKGATLADAVDPTERLLPRFVRELNLLPPDAYAVLAGAHGGPVFTAHVTPLRLPIQNVAIGDFRDNDEVLAAVRASCCLHPRGVELRGERCVDGGLSDSLPLCENPALDTVTVSPFAGNGIDIAPGLADTGGVHLVTPREVLKHERLLERGRAPRRLGNWIRFNPSVTNARALFDAAIPRGRAQAELRFAAGRRDGAAFLQSLGHRPG
ncbi:hypothetical protein KFE25_002708 [Diacronema lutheri]|uniref:PNPLA domain-containing protein n=2 Tax=Diacronema lutheri TaxID=2081491 RepID=A0A8J5XB78_DIALT|nr:hypothetical protein KFE25_002708 [Diacronema lutheri]